jgi:predicted permease
VYATLLRAYSRPFREAYGDDAVGAFGEVYRDASSSGAVAVLRLWTRTVRSVLAGGLRDRLERHREGDVAGGRWSGVDAVRDARQALRTLARRPGFAFATIGLVGLGIGATTTIFSVVYGVLMRPLPYPESERLVHMLKDGSSVPVPDFVDIRQETRTLEALGASHTVTADLTGSGEPERVGLGLVSDALFEILGARAYRGRLFAPAEYEADAERVAVLTMGLWTRRFGADESVIGRTIVLNGERTTVIGVVGADYIAPEALGLDRADVYMPLDLARPDYQNRFMFVLAVVGRMRADAGIEAVQTDLETLAARFRAANIQGWTGQDGGPRSVQATLLRDHTVSGTGNVLWMFLGAVALMLVIACANVANLFLARSTERTHEMAVRAALGAGRRRLIVQLLTESTTLSVAGGLLGMVLAAAGVRAFLIMDPGGIPRVAEVELNAPVLAFALVLSILTGIAFGLAPALSSAATKAAAAMRETGAATTASRSRSRMRGVLVVLQLAMALVLLAGAGILFNSFLHLRGVEPGFEPGNLLTVQLDTGARVPATQRADFVHRLEQRLAVLPGVTAVGLSWRLPFDRGRCCWASRIFDQTAASDTIVSYFHPVTAGYFAALGVTLADGRGFNEADASVGVIAPGSAPGDPGTGHAARMPIIISGTLADRFWPGGGAVGRSFGMPNSPTVYEVVGVIDGMRHWRLDADLGADVYLPFAATAGWDIGLLDVGIRHDGRNAGLPTLVREVFLELDDQLPLDRIIAMDARIAGSIATPRFYAALLATFAILAFLLAAAGVYSSMLYVVGLRRRELGIRATLGAGHGDLLRLVVGRAAVLVLVGTVIGVSLALALGRVIESLTFGVSPGDPATLAIVATLLAAVGIAACWLPARRAARADPVATLRAG